MPWTSQKDFPGSPNTAWGTRSRSWRKKREIEELNNAQELADLVKTKHKVIEELKNSLVEARNCVSAMEEEICSLQANRTEAEDEEHGEQMTHCVSTYNLENIHERYTKVLGILNKEQCSMANAFQLARCPCSTKSKSMSPANMLVQSSSWSWHVADVCDGIYHCWPPCKGRADYFHWPLIQGSISRDIIQLQKKKKGSFRSHQLYKSEWTNRVNFQTNGNFINGVL